MNRLNHEGHDASQYLPRGVPPVNAYRATKGDIVREGESIKAISWMPDRLYVADRLSKEEVNTCTMFYSILIATRRVLGICDLRGILTDKTMENPTKSLEVDYFMEIMNGLPRPEGNMLLWVVCDEYNHGNLELACMLLGTIQHAIENTKNIIDNIKSGA